MKPNRSNEKLIDIRDLFFHVVYRWRSIIIGALIGAIALCALQVVSVKMTHANGEQTAEEKEYAVEHQYFLDSMAFYEQSIANNTEMLERTQRTMEESVRLHLNSQVEWLATRTYYVQVNQEVLDALPEIASQDPADAVLAVYVNSMKSGLDKAEMEALLGTGERIYIDELVSVWADADANTVKVQILGDDPDALARQSKYFDDRLTGLCQEKAQQVYGHTLMLMDEDITMRNSEQSNKMNEFNDLLSRYENAIRNAGLAIIDLEKNEPRAPGLHLVRYAIVGCVLGAALLVIIYIVGYLIRNRLRGADDMRDRCGAPVYGEFPSYRGRTARGIDKWLGKWEHKGRLTDESAICDSVCALLREKFDGGRVALVGTIPEDKLKPLARRLGERLGKTVALDVQPSLLSRGQAIEAACAADGVILVEEKHVSAMRDIEREMEMLSISGAKVAGCIAL